MARKSFLDQMMEIRLADEAKQTLATFQEINNSKPIHNEENDRDGSTQTPSNTLQIQTIPKPDDPTSNSTINSTINSAINSTVDSAIDSAKKQAKQQANQQTDGQTSEQTDKQANRQADKQTSEQTSKLASEQTDKQSDKQANQQVIKTTDNKTSELTNRQASEPTSQQPSETSIEQTSKPANKQVSELTSQQPNEASVEQTSKPANKQVSELTSQQPNEASVEQTKQHIIQQSSQQETQPTVHQAEYSAKETAKHPAPNPSVRQTGATEISPWEAPKALRGLRRSDLTILNHIVERTPLTTTVKDISASTRCPVGTTRSCLEKLKARNFLTWERVYDGCAVGTAYTVFEHTLTLCDAHKDFILQTINGDQWQQNTQQSTQQYIKQYTQQPTKQNPQQTIQQTISPANPSLDRKIKENLSILENLEEEARGLYQLDDDDMALLLPDLHRAGFTSINVKSLVEKRFKHGLDLSTPTIKMIRMGMRHADAALRIGEGSFKGTVSTVVENIVSYTFSTLLRDASFPKPPGWEPEEVVAQRLETERLKQEAERLRLETELKAEVEAREKADREEQDYQAWRTGLAAEDIAAFKNRCPNKKSDEALERFLRVEWRKTLG